MKIREFIKLEADIDVYDDVCEELAICFCGPVKLTEEGKKHFAEVLDYDITVYEDIKSQNIDAAVVSIDGEYVTEWKPRLRKAQEFFNAAAGYCSEKNYNRWFC